jgi:hypothetical protein
MRRQITYDPKRDYYVTLGIDTSATDEDIRLAYRRAVREVHPDLNPDRQDWATRELQRVNEAYGVLSDHTLRRDYDRARWPHVPNESVHRARSRQSSVFGKSTYDPNRPWWEQVSPASTRPSHAGTTAPFRSRHRRRRAMQQSDPLWLSVSGWLKKRHFTRLNALWLALVGLWRSPYAGILSVLGLVLAVDVALILFVLVTPNSWDDVESWLTGRSASTQTSSTTPIEPTVVPDKLNLTCEDPAMQITAPAIGEVVDNSFSVYGTIQRADIWTYSLALGYVGQSVSTVPPPEWTTVRQPPANQSIPEPAIEDDLLTETPVKLVDHPPGFYAIRLRVQLRNGQTLQPCDIVVRYRANP